MHYCWNCFDARIVPPSSWRGVEKGSLDDLTRAEASELTARNEG
jgi:hypothetical protein